MFKAYITEVENQFSKRIKHVRSYSGGEYYDRYDRLREWCPRAFLKCLKEWEIITQYTMRGFPNMNDVAKRWYRTLKNIVRSMIGHFTLSKSLWKNAPKTLAYILNRVSCKVTVKTVYELWTYKKPSLKYLNI